MQAKPAYLRVRLQVRGIDGSDDCSGDLIPVQHHSRRNGGNVGMVSRGNPAEHSE